MTIVTIVTNFPGYGQNILFNALFGKKIKFLGIPKRIFASLCVTIVTFSKPLMKLEHILYKLVTIVTMSEELFCKAFILLEGISRGEKVTIWKRAFVTYRHFLAIERSVRDVLAVFSGFAGGFGRCGDLGAGKGIGAR